MEFIYETRYCHLTLIIITRGYSKEEGIYSNATKRVLKEKGTPFQTPFTKMRIYWDMGTRTHDSTREVKEELARRRLMEVTSAHVAVDDTPEAQLHVAME